MGPIEVLFYSSIGALMVGAVVYVVGRMAVEWHVWNEERTARQIQAHLYRMTGTDQPTTFVPPFVPPLFPNRTPRQRLLPSPRLSRLRDLLTERLEAGQIKAIVFDLNLIEVNEANPKPEQITEMLTELRNYQRIEDLFSWLGEHRPDILEDYQP